MSQPAKAAAAEQQPAAAQPGQGGSAGSRAPQSTVASVPSHVGKGSQAAAVKSRAPGVSTATNGGGTADKPSGQMSWAARLGVNGTGAATGRQPTPAAAPPAQPVPVPASGVKLPAGVTPGPATSSAIKFGSIEAADLQEAPAPPPKAPAAPAAMFPVPAPPAQSAPKPASFAAAASGVGAAGKQGPPPQGAQPRGPYSSGGGPRGSARGPQQQVPAAPLPQGMPSYTAQPGLLYMQPGAFGAQQTYAMAYVPGGAAYFGGGYQQQYPGYPLSGPAAIQQQLHTTPQAHGPSVSLPAGPGLPSGPRPTAYTPTLPSPGPAKPAVQAPPRQRKVLRIENPDTHEVLDLSGMPGNQPKPAEEDKAAASPAPAAGMPHAVADEGAAPSEPSASAASAAVPPPPLAPAPSSQSITAPPPAGEEPSGTAGDSKSFKEAITAEQTVEEAKKLAEAEERKSTEAKQEERKRSAEAKAKQDAEAATRAAAEETKRNDAAALKAAAKVKADAVVVQKEKDDAAARQNAEEAAAAAALVAAAATAAAAAAASPTVTAPETPVAEKPAAETLGIGIRTAAIETGYDDSSGRKRYSTEFMMARKQLCTQIPAGIEAATWSALSVDGEISGGERGGPPPGARGDDRDDRWKSGRLPPGPPAGPGGPPGMRGRPMPGRMRGGPAMAGTIDADTWERGKALPPMPAAGPGVGYGGRGPPPGMRMSSGPLPALHKTGSAYKMGGTITDDPEEEKAQKALKSMLNKITPQNFDKITAQIIEKINERKKAKTLSGFIDQIFDKALAETTFAELYADLVAKLNPALPELKDEEGEAVNFRRTLLNKCQDEFDVGAKAMKAVAEREKREQESRQEAPEEAEDGEITEERQRERDAAAEAKRQDREAAAREVAARKRMLGNIIFVGQLYRFGVLTESVMHTCIRQLLFETENPRPEDIECLCKLLVTMGRPMDASERPVKEYVDAAGQPLTTKDVMKIYFNRIESLSHNSALDSRHCFMLRDLIDLRRNHWVERRKTEGPKKIEDIHRDAAMERSRSQMLDRQGSTRPSGPRGPPSRPPYENRVDAPIRTISTQSAAVQGQSLRPGGRPAPLLARTAAPPPPPSQRKPDEESEQPPVEQGTVSSAEGTVSAVKGILVELFSSGDVKEATTCLRELADSGGVNMGDVVDSLFSLSLDGKGTSWTLLSELLSSARHEDAISGTDLQQGIRSLLTKLDDLTVDVPKAPTQVGDVLGRLVAAQVADLKVIGQHILEADAEEGEPQEGEQDTLLVGGGGAANVICSLLRSLKEAIGGGLAKSSWKATELQLASFMPATDRNEAEKLAALATKYDVVDLLD